MFLSCGSAVVFLIVVIHNPWCCFVLYIYVVLALFLSYTRELKMQRQIEVNFSRKQKQNINRKHGEQL